MVGRGDIQLMLPGTGLYAFDAKSRFDRYLCI
jgi:hypothetical protein